MTGLMNFIAENKPGLIPLECQTNTDLGKANSIHTISAKTSSNMTTVVHKEKRYMMERRAAEEGMDRCVTGVTGDLINSPVIASIFCFHLI